MGVVRLHRANDPRSLRGARDRIEFFDFGSAAARMVGEPAHARTRGRAMGWDGNCKPNSSSERYVGRNSCPNRTSRRMERPHPSSGKMHRRFSMSVQVA